MRPLFHPLALLLFAVSWTATAQPKSGSLGTLFYSPEERAAIAAAREGKTGQETPAGLTVGGIIKRAPGKGTVWINGKPVAEGQAVPSATAPSLTAHGIILNGKPVRVGETLNPATGERTDLIAPGALHVGKQK